MYSTKIAEYKIHNGPITDACFHPTQPYIITSGSDGKVKFFEVNLSNLRQISTLRLYVGNNYKKEQSRVALWETVDEVFRRFEKSNLEYHLPLLNAIEDRFYT